MKELKWYLTALFVIGFVVSAEAQFPPEPKPRPAAASQATAAPVQAPPVQAAPSEVASPPVINVAAPAPNHQFDILMWIWTALGSIFTGLKTKEAFWPAKATTGGHALVMPATVTDLLGKIKDPATKQALDAHLLQIALGAAQNPLTHTAVQTGLGFIPGVGPAAAALDQQFGPVIRDLGIKALQDLIAKQEAKAA